MKDRKIREIKRKLEHGDFECLLCDHKETDPEYLISEERAFCRNCGSGLYSWPSVETVTILFNDSLSYLAQ